MKLSAPHGLIPLTEDNLLGRDVLDHLNPSIFKKKHTHMLAEVRGRAR